MSASTDQATGQEASNKVHAFANERTQTGSAEAAIQNLVRHAYALTRQARHGIVTEATAFAWRDAASVATHSRILNDDIYEAVAYDYRCRMTCTYHSGNSAWTCHQPCTRPDNHHGRCACYYAPDSAHRGDLD